MISREEFEKKALKVLEQVLFTPDMKLFDGNELRDFIVTDECGTLPLDDYIDLLYNELIEN